MMLQERVYREMMKPIKQVNPIEIPRVGHEVIESKQSTQLSPPS